MADAKENKQLLSEGEIRDKILEGAKATYEAVTQTYGPRGKNVLLEKNFGRPILTRDGVTVARDVFFSDRAKNMGAQILGEASEVTNRNAGDGTTQTIALSYHLLKNGNQAIAAGVHPMKLRDELTADNLKIQARLKDLAKPVGKGQLVQVATVSAGDPLIGQLIAEAIEYVGQDGGILTEKAPISDVEREYVDGYYLQSGFTALQAGKKELANPIVIVSSKRITGASDMLDVMNSAAELSGLQPGQIPRFLFVGNFEDAAYNTVVNSINQGTIDAVVIKTPPMFGDGKQLLEDVAIYAQCRIIDDSTNIKGFSELNMGMVDKIVTNKSESTLFADNTAGSIQVRVAELKDQLKEEVADHIAEKLRDRIAKLEGKIAIFKIGGTTDTAKEELEFRIEDAINATKAAFSDGIVAGGGVTLLELSKLDISDTTKNALRSCFMQLLINANMPAELKLDEALKAPVGHGFNLRKSDELVDVVKSGVIDPVVVTREVVKNATGAIGNALTVGAALIFVSNED